MRAQTLFALLYAVVSITAIAQEGFFADLTGYKALADSGIPASVVANAFPNVGAYVLEYTPTLTKSKVAERRALLCTEPSARAWNAEDCATLEQVHCTTDDACEVKLHGYCTGVFAEGVFITARHCARTKQEAPLRARFIDAHGLPHDIALRATAFTEHQLPYDIALFEAASAPAPGVPIRRDEPGVDEIVFGIGFPGLAARDTFQLAYGPPRGTPAMVFGRVIDPNKDNRSICNFANQTDDWKRGWKWSKTCNGEADTSKEEREERGPLLADADMINGMSGSPLFDREGRLVGIGSNTLVFDALNYDATKPAVYVKAKRILELLKK